MVPYFLYGVHITHYNRRIFKFFPPPRYLWCFKQRIDNCLYKKATKVFISAKRAHPHFCKHFSWKSIYCCSLLTKHFHRLNLTPKFNRRMKIFNFKFKKMDSAVICIISSPYLKFSKLAYTVYIQTAPDISSWYLKSSQEGVPTAKVKKIFNFPWNTSSTGVNFSQF